MKTQIKTTITVKPQTWKELQNIRINGGYTTLDEVIQVLLGHHLFKRDRK